MAWPVGCTVRRGQELWTTASGSAPPLRLGAEREVDAICPPSKSALNAAQTSGWTWMAFALDEDRLDAWNAQAVEVGRGSAAPDARG